MTQMPAPAPLRTGPTLSGARAELFADPFTGPHGTDVIPTQYRRDTDSGCSPAKSPVPCRPSRAQSFTEMRP